jgi:flagellar biosynthesis/type III secretory pathway M-ring protein FliF/YscJ
MRHKILVVGGVIALVLFVLWLVVSTIISHTTSPESKQKRLEKHKKQRELEQQEREAALNEVTCGNGMLMARVGDLPPRLRTFRLRFLDLKSKVCRPFPK